MKTLYLIACSKYKRRDPKPAQELYCSDLFMKSRTFVESQLQEGDSWLILSAKHGLLTPTQRVEPYDKTLKDMTPHERNVWGDSVWQGGLESYLQVEGIERIVFLAGRNYQSRILKRLDRSELRRHVRTEDPMYGMEIGERLHWLKEVTPKKERAA